MKTNQHNLEDFLIRFLCDSPLEEDHPRSELQKQFLDFMNDNEITKAEVLLADLYNDGDCVSFHFQNESFLILCKMDEEKMVSSILSDKEILTYDIFEETVFDWDLLLKRIVLYSEYSEWQNYFSKEKTLEFIKDRLENL